MSVSSLSRLSDISPTASTLDNEYVERQSDMSTDPDFSMTIQTQISENGNDLNHSGTGQFLVVSSSIGHHRPNTHPLPSSVLSYTVSPSLIAYVQRYLDSNHSMEISEATVK